jgi:hypothetical protein
LVSRRAQPETRSATFREVLRGGEFRAIYAASTLSWVGDYIARAAVTALVFQATESVTASAAAFAISYAPWLLGGSFLVSLAERYPYRTVMVWCDVIRMLIMVAVGAVALPVPAVLALLLASALFSPPFDAARSAMLPAILGPDRYVVGVALHTATGQPAQVLGYVVGSALAVDSPRTALLINAATFAVSALLVRFRVRLRPAALDPSSRSHLLHETVDGFRVVFATPALRSVVLLVFAGCLFVIVPEGLAAAWAAESAPPDQRGWAQGMIMGAVPLGSILGALVVSRFTPPERRRQLLRPLALATPLALVPALADPPVVVVAVLAGACGFAMGGLVPIANGEFVRALPNMYRARAFGVVQAGLHLLQGTAVLATGVLAQRVSLAVVVGLWSLAGVALMIVLSLTWPSPRAFADAIAAAAGPGQGPAAIEDPTPTPTQPRSGRHRAAAPRPGTMEP